LALLVFAVAGCNSVLGIEEASLDPTAGGFTTSGAGGTTQTGGAVPEGYALCDEPEPKCSACLRGQPGLAECLADGDCRVTLNTYRAKLGPGCVDEGQAAFEALDEPIMGTPRYNLARAITGACAADCATGSLASICELYCACMAENCVTYDDPPRTGDLIEPPVYDPALCMSDCMEMSPEVVGCRFGHCQANGYHAKTLPLYNDAGVPRSIDMHCEHAIGGHGICPRTLALYSTCQNPNGGLQRDSWCDDSSQCCSQSCETEMQRCL
jgi:hypothetical protein